MEAESGSVAVGTETTSAKLSGGRVITEGKRIWGCVILSSGVINHTLSLVSGGR